MPHGVEERAVRRALRHARNGPAIFATEMGARAVAVAEAVLSGRTLDCALIAGLCGAATPALSVGEPLLYGSIQDLNGQAIALDAGYARALGARLTGAQTGIRGLSVDSVVSRAADKRELAARYGIEALDMESFALTRRLHAAGVRVAILRVPSDDAHDDLPDLSGAVDANGRLSRAKLTFAMLRAPGAAVRLSAGALRALGALERSVRDLALG